MIVAIAGGAGAGKSTLAIELAHRHGLTVIHMDDFFLPLADAKQLRGSHGRLWLDRNHPESFDLPAICRALDGQATRGHGIVFEGHFALVFSQLRNRYSRTYWLDTPADVRLARKFFRKAKAGRQDMHLVAAGYLDNVRPAHERFVQPSSEFARHIIDGMLPVHEQIKHINKTLGPDIDDGRPRL